jgi:HEXXH motif-containing protein
MQICPELDPTALLPPFQSSLPAALRQSGEGMLLRDHHLTRETYSTASFLAGTSSARDIVLKTVVVGDQAPLHFEGATSDVVRYCSRHHLRLADDEHAKLAAELVHAALSEVIASHQCLMSAISDLVWRCHIVEAQDDDYDVSFSDPAIPFSIFVSTPARNDRRSLLRIAENVIHETMHLQLTLFELSCPLIDAGFSSWSMYSPWKQQARPAQGILHGLYVFHVLHWTWRRVVETAQNEIDRDFARGRVKEIESEITSVRSFENSPALTSSGNLFLQRLFAS